ncbi:MAG: TolC family protein, partial [Flavobacteriales bacterium]|nr:TolC family protein [Flavobacteriales bacterium]
MIILLGLFTTGLVFPQTSNDTVSFTRDKCIQIALENHLEMKNAIMDEKIAKAEVLSAWDIPATDFRLERGQINYEQIDNHFSFLQSFGNIAQQIAQTSYNKQRLHLMKIYTRKKEAEITWQVSALYDEMTAALQKRKLLNREKQMLDELKRITQLAYDAGVSEYVDLLSITMSSQLLERRLMDLEASYAELASQLKTYLNIQTACKPLNDTLAPMRLPDDNVFPDSTQTLMIKPYYQTLLLSKKQLQTQRSAFWPGISAGYFNQQLEHVNGFQGFFVGLSIPILSFKNYTAVRVASLNKMKAENELSFQTQKLRNDIYALYQKIKKSEERISSYTSRSLPEAENLVKQAQVQYKTGVIDFQNFYFFFNQAMQVQYAYIDECLLHNQLVLAYSYLTAK